MMKRDRLFVWFLVFVWAVLLFWAVGSVWFFALPVVGLGLFFVKGAKS
jgi:hypothetical protein